MISQISFNFFKKFSVAYLIYWFIPHNSPDGYSLITIFINVTCNVNFTDLVQTLLFYSPLFLHSLGSCVELYLQTVRRKNNFSEHFSQSSPEKCHKYNHRIPSFRRRINIKTTVLYCTTKCFSYWPLSLSSSISCILILSVLLNLQTMDCKNPLDNFFFASSVFNTFCLAVYLNWRKWNIY